jgi:SAM-dependent methyltransferase
MHALDLGSGTGELCWLLRDIGARRVVGVNLSREEIEFASSRVEAQFVCQDVLAYLESVQSESIDVAYALNFLEHLDKETLVRVLSQVHRCLRANGRLVAMVPNATSPFAGMTRYWDITHQIAFTPASVAQLGRLLGYSSWEFRECGPVPHGVVSAVRRLLWLAIRSLIKAYLLVELGSSKGGIYTADMLFRLTKHTNGQH